MQQPADAAIAQRIEALLAQRREDASICPSEVARSLASDEASWRALMPHIRRVADTMAAQGRLRVTQGGQDVNAIGAKGPIRLRSIGSGSPG
jgi:hypothetical protein